jgi:hypothetical protein
VIAFLLGNSLMFLFGAVASAFYQTNDISLALKAQGLIAVSVLVLGLNIWTTNDNALYAAQPRLRHADARAQAEIRADQRLLGTVFATAAYNHFVPCAELAQPDAPSIGAILILDYFRRAPPRADAEPDPASLGGRRRLGRRFCAAKFLPGIPPPQHGARRFGRLSPPRPPAAPGIRNPPMPQTSQRVGRFTESVIRRMTRVAMECGAVNLSQGFPDFDPPEELRVALEKTAHAGPHQYAVTWGAPAFGAPSPASRRISPAAHRSDRISSSPAAARKR